MAKISHHEGRLLHLTQGLGELAQRSLAPWLDAGLDPQGGAYGFLDRYFRPVFFEDDPRLGPSKERRGDQSLVQQSRHLFSYCLMAERRPGDERLEVYSKQLYEHLCHGFRRQTSGDGLRCRPLLHWIPRGRVSQRGEQEGDLSLCSHLERTRGQTFAPPSAGLDFDEENPQSPFAVQLYAQGFAVYALSTYARVFAVPAAAHFARDLFLTLDEKRHDSDFGGYDQSQDGGWLPFVAAPAGAVKCTNTHIHLLEALTPLCLAFPQDELLNARLSELARLIATRLLQPQGYVHKFFQKDWSPIGAKEVSYGHDLETSWLLLDALKVLAQNSALDADTESQVRQGSRKMAKNALAYGWDEAGGVYDSGFPGGFSQPAHVQDRGKIWWAQAEALVGIYHLYRVEPSDDLLDKLEATFRFLKEKSWDKEGGEYFWGVDSEGCVAGRGDHKGEMWKTPYHALRACLYTADLIQADLLA